MQESGTESTHWEDDPDWEAEAMVHPNPSTPQQIHAPENRRLTRSVAFQVFRSVFSSVSRVLVLFRSVFRVLVCIQGVGFVFGVLGFA